MACAVICFTSHQALRSFSARLGHGVLGTHAVTGPTPKRRCSSAPAYLSAVPLQSFENLSLFAVHPPEVYALWSSAICARAAATISAVLLACPPIRHPSSTA